MNFTNLLKVTISFVMTDKEIFGLKTWFKVTKTKLKKKVIRCETVISAEIIGSIKPTAITGPH